MRKTNNFKDLSNKQKNDIYNTQEFQDFEERITRLLFLEFHNEINHILKIIDEFNLDIRQDLKVLSKLPTLKLKNVFKILIAPDVYCFEKALYNNKRHYATV